MLKLIRNNTFLRNVSIVMTGTAISQIISVAISPLLTRMYGAEAFGVMGMFIASVTVISTIAALRYDLAVVLPKENEEARSIFIGGICICLFICLMILPFSYFKIQIMQLISIEKYPNLYYLIPLAVFLLTVSSLYDSWLSRHKSFKLISQSAVVGTLASSLIMLIGGGLELGVVVLIFGSIANNLLKITYIIINMKSQVFDFDYLKHVKIKILKGVLHKYIDFPLYRAPQDLINSLSQNAPGLILGFLFDAKLVGFFWLANRVLRLPSTLVSEAVRKVLYQKMSEISNDGKSVTEPALKATIGLSFIGIVPVLIMFLFGIDLFSIIFGEDWSKAGEYSKWISIWVFFLFINVPAVVIIPVLGLQKFFLKYMLYMLPVRLLPLVIVGYQSKDDVLAVATFCIVNAFTNLILIVYVLNKSKDIDKENRNPKVLG